MSKRWLEIGKPVLVTAIVAGAMTACGGSSAEPVAGDESDLGTPGTQATSEATPDTVPAEPESSEDQDGGSGSLTLLDGTVLDFVFTSCDTSDTKPNALPLSNGVDIFGKTSDSAFSFQLIRAGFDDDSAVASGSVEGDFDDEGKNSKLLYFVKADTLDITVTGGEVAATFALGKIGPTDTFGKETEATLEAHC